MTRKSATRNPQSAIEKKRSQARIRKQNQRARERQAAQASGKALPATSSQLVSTSAQSPLASAMNDFVFRKVDGNYYETLREGIPIFDAAIRRLITLNGTIKIIGEKMDCVTALEDFCLNVPVCDMQKGIHAFSENIENETFEQGFGMAEFVATKKRDDIERLVVADSKQLFFRRNKTTSRLEPWFRAGEPKQRNYTMPGTIIQQIIETRYGQTVSYNGVEEVRLNPDNKMYRSNNNENQDPHGVSLFRSTEFGAQIRVILHNSMKNSAERFGDPIYHAHVESAAKDGSLETRRKTVETDLNKVITAKRQGKSGDIVTAGGLQSKVTITILGHDGQLFQYEVPLREVTEDLCAKFGLPAWLLGRYWSTTERMATLEVEMALAEARIRQAAMLPEYIRLFSNFLRLRGKTWNAVTTSTEKKGDWGIIFESPNIRDLVAMAQADFLTAQASQMRRGGAPTATTQNPATQVPVGGSAMLTTGAASFEIEGMKFEVRTTQPGVRIQEPEVGSPHASPLTPGSKCSCGHDHSVSLNAVKELNRPIPWPEMDKVEKEYERELKYDWNELKRNIFEIVGLKLPEEKSPHAPHGSKEFTFGDAERDMIMRSLKTFLGYYDPDGPDSSVAWYYGQSYSLGLIQAAQLLGKERPILDILKNNEIFTELITDGFRLVRDNATRRIRNDVIMAMEDGVTRGANPIDVARKLSDIFDAQNSDWERLARTEMAGAAERAKLDEWKERGVDVSGAVTVPVHPRCRCSNSVQDDGNGNFRTKFVPAPDACPLCLSMQEGDKALAAAVARDLFALRRKGITQWYRSFQEA